MWYSQGLSHIWHLTFGGGCDSTLGRRDRIHSTVFHSGSWTFWGSRSPLVRDFWRWKPTWQGILVHSYEEILKELGRLSIEKRVRKASVQFSHSVVSDSLRPHELQQARPPCPSPTPRVHPNSCPLSWWCHLTISSSVIPFSSLLQSFPASGSFQMSPFFTSGGQSIGVSASASALAMNTQDWSPLGWTG